MNPFNYTLDSALRGKEVRVSDNQGRIYEGWLDRVHHQRGSVVLHDAKKVSGSETSLGSVFIRQVDTIAEIGENGQKRIDLITLDSIRPHPNHDTDFDVVDSHLRNAYRDGFTGSFPVVRCIWGTDETIRYFQTINGHKRLEAAKAAGMEAHPCEVISCTDEQASELFELAHRSEIESAIESADE